MSQTYEGQLSGSGLKVAVVAGRFNSFIVDQLIGGAVDGCKRTGVSEDDIAIYKCPGAFEIPQVVRKVLDKGGVDAVICVGAVIRGSTPHFDYVAGEVSKGIGQLALGSNIPVSFGVITTDTIEQAIERAGTKAGNKGFDAAMAAIEMVNLYRTVDGS